jgi:hypothetical protein
VRFADSVTRGLVRTFIAFVLSLIATVALTDAAMSCADLYHSSSTSRQTLPPGYRDAYDLDSGSVR